MLKPLCLPQEETEDEKENASIKRKLQPLGNLPHLHPLLRESSSDEGYTSLNNIYHNVEEFTPQPPLNLPPLLYCILCT